MKTLIENPSLQGLDSVPLSTSTMTPRVSGPVPQQSSVPLSKAEAWC